MNNEENLDFIDSLPTALTHIRSLMTIIRGKNEKLSSRDAEIQQLKDSVEHFRQHRDHLQEAHAKALQEIQQLKEEVEGWKRRYDTDNTR